jgi:hypothetical protein
LSSFQQYRFAMAEHHHHDHSACLAIAWFNETEWRKLKEIADDKDALDDTYDEWLANIERLERQLHDSGQHAHRIALNVDKLARWCQARNRPLDGNARSTYAAALAQRGQLG